MTDIQIKGQLALVTGASRGIGAAIALELARRGLRVIGTATTEAGAASVTQALSGLQLGQPTARRGANAMQQHPQRLAFGARTAVSHLTQRG